MENENYNQLENDLKRAIEKKKLIERELLQLETKNEGLRNEVIKKTTDIQQVQKQLIQKENAVRSASLVQKIPKPSNIITLEEQIQKHFTDIQNKCNISHMEKYKIANIEKLICYQRELKIKYIIVKKLSIKEDFYVANKINEVPNLFENLKAFAKIGKLNYEELKNCGQNIVFSLTSDSNFSDLKNAACKIWDSSVTSFSFYDDLFVNLECINNTSIQQYYSMYQPLDPSLPLGHVCIYLIERLKDQWSILDIHKKLLDKAESGQQINNDNNKGQGIFSSDLDNCITKIEEGLILKGISAYKSDIKDTNKVFKDKLKVIDNNIIFILITTALIVLSVYGIQAKKRDMLQWSNAQLQIFNLLNSSLFTDEPSRYSYTTYLIENIKKLKNQSENGIKLFGQIQIRYFRSNQRPCVDEKQALIETNEIYFKLTRLICYYSDYIGTNINETSIFTETNEYKYSKDIDILHIYNTRIGTIGTGGIAIRIDPSNSTDYDYKIKELEYISDKTNGQLKEDIQGIEMQLVIYDTSLDMFNSVSFLIQRKIDRIPIIIEQQTIPFITNVYENNFALEVIDIVRIILFLLFFTSFILRIIQKCYSLKNKSKTKLTLTIFSTLLQIKSLLVIFSTSFFLAAYSYFYIYKIDSNEYAKDHSKFIDFVNFAYMQKEAGYLEMISLYLLVIYGLKYLQFLPLIGEYYQSLKKSAFELFCLFTIIFVLLLALSYCTYYVYGIYFEEYAEFYHSFITNIRIFLFIENCNLKLKLPHKFEGFTIFLFYTFITLIRSLMMYLVYPIIMEYLRKDLDSTRKLTIALNRDFTMREKLKKFFCSFKNFKFSQINNKQNKTKNSKRPYTNESVQKNSQTNFSLV